MSFCSNPHSLAFIDLGELIGKSLNTINTNFSILTQQICSENTHILKIQDIYSSLQNRLSHLQDELRGSPIAYVLFDGAGNFFSGKRISVVNKLATGTYQVFFSTAINSPYLTIPENISSTQTHTSITNETINSVIVTNRQLNGNLVDPEKISLTFFT
jgi:hypothetical protein